MKPAMEQLISDYKNTDGILVASVVCDKEGESLCDSHNMRSFPTMWILDSNDKKVGECTSRSHSGLKECVTSHFGPPSSDVSV